MHAWKKTAAFMLTAAMIGSMVGCNTGDKSEGSGKSDSDSVDVTGDFTIGLDEIAQAMGAGWNLGNQLESANNGKVDETCWGNPTVTQELIAAVADAGFTTIRVPVSYLDKIDDDNNYAVDSAWLDRVEEVVNYCYQEGLYVIINMHGDGYNTVDGGWFLVNGDDQDYICEKYQAVWKQIAQRFAEYDEHLIFESMNEEFDGEYSDPNPDYYENLNTYNQLFVDTVRETGSNNTHRWLLVPGWNTNIDYTVGDYGFTMPTDDTCSAGENRLMLSVHYYDPWDYCGKETIKTYLWGERGQALVNEVGFPTTALPSWGQEDYLQEQFRSLADNYVSKGIPVIIGEYGAIDKSTANIDRSGEIQSNRVYYNGYVAGTAASMGIIPVYWDNGSNSVYGFGLFDRKTYEQTQPEIISTIVKAVADKDPMVGGDVSVEATVEKASELHAYLGIQTNVYTFRNACGDAQYGLDSEYFNTLIKWEDQDGDGTDDIVDTGATFEDATITGDGTYSVSVSGYDFSSDSEGLNMLFISTDITYFSTLRISDVTLSCDDTTYEVKPIVAADDSGKLYIELINIYNTDTSVIDYTMPTDSFTVTFTISGTENVLS